MIFGKIFKNESGEKKFSLRFQLRRVRVKINMLKRNDCTREVDSINR